jgi:hypothetical protein
MVKEPSGRNGEAAVALNATALKLLMRAVALVETLTPQMLAAQPQASGSKSNASFPPAIHAAKEVAVSGAAVSSGELL